MTEMLTLTHATERDIDLMLVEELAASQAFARWFLNPSYSPNPAPLASFGGFEARNVLHPGL